MEFFKNIVDYFDKHPGYELLMSFAALVFSIIPYVFRFFCEAVPAENNAICI